MKISELVKALNKVQQIVGDAPVILKQLEGDVGTVVKQLVIAVDPTQDDAGGTVTIEHGTPAPVVPAPAEPPAGPDVPVE
jgi:hypothetical protein